MGVLDGFLEEFSHGKYENLLNYSTKGVSLRAEARLRASNTLALYLQSRGNRERWHRR